MNEKYAEQSETKFLFKKSNIKCQKGSLYLEQRGGDHGPLDPSSGSTPNSILSNWNELCGHEPSLQLNSRYSLFSNVYSLRFITLY